MPTRLQIALATSSVLMAVGTCLDGGTTHAGALALRLGALTVIAAAFTRPSISCGWRELGGPAAMGLALLLSAASEPRFGFAMQGIVAALFVVGTFLLSLHEPTGNETRDPATTRAPVLRWPKGAFLESRGSIWWWASCVGALHALWAIGQLALGATKRGQGGFFDPNELAAFLAPLLAVALAQALAPRPVISDASPAASATTSAPDARPILSPWAFIAGLLALGLVATLSRAGLVAASIAAVIVVWGRSRGAALALLLLVVALAASTPHVRQRFAQGGHDRYAYARFDIWKASVELAIENPLGVGLGGYDEAMRVHGVPLNDVLRYPKRAHHAHSEPLNLWVELGWPGLATVFVTLGMIAAALDRVRRRFGQRAALDDLAVFAAFAIPAALSASLHVAPIALLASYWAATLVSRGRGGDSTETSAVVTLTPRTRLAIAVTLGLATLATLPKAASYVLTRTAADARSRGGLHEATMHARLARNVDPTSLVAAMLHESLVYLREQDALASAERLADLADRHPHEVHPVERAAWLMETLARERPAEATDALDKALKLREEALRRDPKNAAHALQLANTRLHANDAAGARMALEAALEIEPNCAKALARLARDDDARGDPTLASERAARALDATRHARRYGAAGKALLELDESTLRTLDALAAKSASSR